MNRRIMAMTSIVAFTLIAAACSGGETDAATTTTMRDPELLVTSSVVGEYLSDSTGRTVYVYLADPPNESTCTGPCAETWPPVPAPMGRRSGVKADLLGEIQRPDGTTQVTYNGHPLYFYSGDTVPGDFRGQGAGDAWYVMHPDGEPIVPQDPDQ